MKKNIDSRKLKNLLYDSTEPRNMRTIAVVFWRMLIVVAVTASLLAILSGVWMFESTLQQLEAAQAPAPIPKSPFNRDQFDAVVKAFSDRQLQYQVIEAAPPVAADPSK